MSVASFKSRLKPLDMGELLVFTAIFKNLDPLGLDLPNIPHRLDEIAGHIRIDTAIGASPKLISNLFAYLTAHHYDSTNPDLAILTAKDSLLHTLVDGMGLSRLLSDRLFFHTEYSGDLPLARGKRFRYILVNQTPANRSMRFYQVLSSQCQRLLIETRKNDKVKGIDGHSAIERCQIFSKIIEFNPKGS